MSELMLDVGQANELKMAFRRHGYAPEDVKRLGEGGLLAQVLLIIRGRAEVIVKSILVLLRTVRIVAQPTITTSEEYFNEEAGVVWMSNDFKDRFLGLEVRATEEVELAVHRLREESLDEPILAELGGKAEISVSQFRSFLNTHRKSQGWFIFYLKGRDGKLAVGADWHADDGGWYVDAGSVTRPFRWRQGDQVVSQV